LLLFCFFRVSFPLLYPLSEALSYIFKIWPLFAKRPQVSEWMKEYIASTKLSTFGFRPAPSFYGKTFKEAARELGNNNIAALAVQVSL